MTRIGIGYRRPLAKWINKNPDLIQCLEITAEHFFDQGHACLNDLSQGRPVYVHGLGLSLGTPGPLDSGILSQFQCVAKLCNAEWVSEHIAFTRSSEIDLGHLNPLPRTKSNLAVLTEHVNQMSEFCGKPVLLENVTAYLDPGGNIDEPEFLNQLCEQSACHLLLDVTNLFINSKNHGFNPGKWLHRIQPENIHQLHVVGYHCKDGIYNDHHGSPIQDDLMDLIAEVLEYADVKSVILERDQNLNRIDEIEMDLSRLKNLIRK